MIIHGLNRLLVRVLSTPVRFWRLFSQFLPHRCRFYPSCSAYALGALDHHGPARGSWLALRRVGRCHPWHEGGLDPVPLARGSSLPAANVALPLDRRSRVVS